MKSCEFLGAPSKLARLLAGSLARSRPRHLALGALQQWARELASQPKDAIEALPHDEQALSHMVLFSLRVGDVAELNKLLPMARLRLHVVLQVE